MTNNFTKRGTKDEVELGTDFTPKFDDKGLIPCITTDNETGEVLMFAFMNAKALMLSIQNAEAYYYSRSRQKLWHKGESSGLIQKIISMRTDCDQDCILISVEIAKPDKTDGKSATCHQGYKSCFYRDIMIEGARNKELKLNFNKIEKVFAPKDVY